MTTMRRGRSLVWAALLALAADAAAAQAPYVDIEHRLSAEQLRATGLDRLTPAQLALLNQLLRDDPAAAESSADTAASTPVAPAHAPPAPPAPIAVAGTTPPVPPATPAVDEPARTGNFIGLNDDPIKSRLKGMVAGWEPGTVFELENGQQWKVLKGSATLRKPLQSPEILVVPGIAGRWFLQVDEDYPKARVYRIN